MKPATIFISLFWVLSTVFAHSRKHNEHSRKQNEPSRKHNAHSRKHKKMHTFTQSRFDEFRAEIEEMLSCGLVGGPNSTCKGLHFTHPLTTLHDMVETGSFKGALGASLLRLAFHDCGGIDPVKARSGKNDFFTNKWKNGEAGGCNGCIGIDNFHNDGLLEGAIDPMIPLCEELMDEGLISRADCWALAATIAVEFASEQLDLHRDVFNITIEPAVKKGDIPYYYGRSDCQNGYTDGSGGVEYEFSNPKGVIFEFPDALQGWKHTSEFFKSRFSFGKKKNKFTNRDIISLISGAHSMARAHVKISGYSGAWDFTPQTLDGEFISILFNEDYSFSPQFTNTTIQNLNTSIRTNEPGAQPQWSMKQHPGELALFPILSILNPPVSAFENNLNTDISMVYDISYYIERSQTNAVANGINCQTNAEALCTLDINGNELNINDQIILTAPRGRSSLYNKGKTGEQLGEQYECKYGQNCCKFIQCPIQCEGGLKRYNELIGGNLDKLSDNLNCPAALAKRYSNQFSPNWVKSNHDLGADFTKAFTKMITIGYSDRDGDVMLKVVGE
eukprot:545765_1